MIKATLSASLFFCAEQDQPKSCCLDLNLPTIMRKPFYFLRHGQTDLNLERRHQGQQNNPLNATGREQAHKAGSILSNYEINSLCSSPLLRAQQTSEIVAEQVPSKIYYLEDLKERFKGQAEGLLYEDCHFENTFTAITDEQPLGAESNKSFLTRTVHVIHKALEMPGPVLIVTHGAILHCLCFYLKITLPDEIERANCLPLLFSPLKHGWAIKVLL